MSKWKLLLASRKFWAALIGLVLMVVKQVDPNFPLAEDQLTNLVYIIVAYILGTALEDVKKANPSNAPPG
jgi:uncharacterized membrane protein